MTKPQYEKAEEGSFVSDTNDGGKYKLIYDLRGPDQEIVLTIEKKNIELARILAPGLNIPDTIPNEAL